MAVKVRLTRVGSKKNPIWRVVVADGRSPRDGRTIETIGHYNPQTQPSRIQIDRERLQHWLDRGAQPSNTVKKLIRAENTGVEKPAGGPPPEPVPATRSEPEPEAAAEPAPAAEAESAAEGDAAPEATAEGDAAPEADAAGPGEDASVDVPAEDVAADESEAHADADENP